MCNVLLLKFKSTKSDLVNPKAQVTGTFVSKGDVAILPSVDNLANKLSGWIGNSTKCFPLCAFRWTFLSRHVKTLTMILLFRNVTAIHYVLHSAVGYFAGRVPPLLGILPFLVF